VQFVTSWINSGLDGFFTNIDLIENNMLEDTVVDHRGCIWCHLLCWNGWNFSHLIRKTHTHTHHFAALWKSPGILSIWKVATLFWLRYRFRLQLNNPTAVSHLLPAPKSDVSLGTFDHDTIPQESAALTVVNSLWFYHSSLQFHGRLIPLSDLISADFILWELSALSLVVTMANSITTQRMTQFAVAVTNDSTVSSD